MAEETWKHMQEIRANRGEHSRALEEWFVCSCGLAGAKRDPHDSRSWDEIWWEALQHLREVEQITDPYPDAQPWDGFGGKNPQNLWWAFRSDSPVEARRAAREYYNIPAPPQGG